MHDHMHDHTHEQDSYWVDQLCMVGLSGAFGVICLTLWYWQRSMLGLMLGEQFHLYVVCSGYVLVTLALVRGWVLWGQSKNPQSVAGHSHVHHDHEHGACGHDHGHGETCAHGHDHAPGHEHHHHHHHHDHEAADHDHGWAPWRYVVILVPIILFLLGLPNKPPTIMADHGRTFSTVAPDVESMLVRIGLGADPVSQLANLNGMMNGAPATEDAKYVYYKELEGFADNAQLREDWKGRAVKVVGQYSPRSDNDHVFMLARLKISCCANDAVQLNVPMIAREPIRGYKLNDWVRVTGKVDFRKDAGGTFRTVVLISKASDVQACEPDTNPYVQ